MHTSSRLPRGHKIKESPTQLASTAKRRADISSTHNGSWTSIPAKRFFLPFVQIPGTPAPTLNSCTSSAFPSPP